MTLHITLSGALLVFALQPALAQNKKVYRCEDVTGRVTYADEACRGGVALKNSDERSAEQRQAAIDVARRDESLADKMARERRAAEKAAPKQAAAAHIANSAAEKAAAHDKLRAKAPSKKKKKPAPEAKTQA